MRSLAFLTAMALAVGALSGCSLLEMRAAVEGLNTAQPAGKPPPPRTAVQRVARLTERHMTDAYFTPAAVSGWLDAMAARPAELIALVSCVDDARERGRSSTACHDAFSRPGSPAHAWGLPGAAPTGPSRSDDSGRRELDASRFLGNAHALAAAISQLNQNYGDTLAGCAEGIAQGARRSAAYLRARGWQRGDAPTTALVLGGGAGNGAFGAGLTWRLLDVLQQCRGVDAAQGGCGDAHIDLVVGTSVGTLIGALVDLFHTRGQQQQALDLLVDSFTCSVEADLYCVPDEYIWRLFHDRRGIVHFDGIASKIDRFITPEVEANALELVGVTQDLRYGEILGFSDQNPADASVGCGRREALLASIVLPVMASPVASIDLQSGRREGPFVDGGVGSVVPMLEAVQRGAGRVVVVSMYPMQPEPVAEPKNAFDVLLRAMTLAMLQPGANEMAHGQLYANARRDLAQHVCARRVAQWSPPGDQQAWAEFCGAPGAAGEWTGALPIGRDDDEFRSAWIFRTEELDSVLGYRFDPAAMRLFFEAGVETFQQRCPEILEVLGIGGSVARAACEVDDAMARVGLKSLDECRARPIPTCGGEISCDGPSWRARTCRHVGDVWSRYPQLSRCGR